MLGSLVLLPRLVKYGFAPAEICHFDLEKNEALP